MTKTRGGRQKTSALVDLADESKEWRAPLAPPDTSQPSTSTRSTRSTRSSNASAAATATATVGTTHNDNDNNTSTSTTTSTTRKRSKKKKTDETLRSDPYVIQALNEADYEANVDPYRGINPCFAISYNNGSQDGIDATIPWKQCDDVLTVDKLVSTKWKFISNNNEQKIVNVDEGEEDYDSNNNNNNGDSNNNNVALLVQCDCPTVNKWAMDEMETYNKQINAKKKKRGKKRKKNGSENNNSSADEMKSGDDDDDDDSIEKAALNRGPHLICGERKKDSKNATLLHPCDYNPYCLASLGGIIDQYRHIAAKVKNVIATTTSLADETTPSGISGDDIAQQIRKNLTLTLNIASSRQKKKNGKKDAKIDNGLRGKICVDLDVIQDHVSRFICEGGESDYVAVSNILQQIQHCHESLFYPTSDESSSKSSGKGTIEKVELSQPSGLRNLGATCYLNSQLQCLAQNLGFIHGLFSWKKPSDGSGGSNGSKRMTEVLSHMQSILARMRYGPDRVLCTNEFASALNLENNEMQDPNEFARLLFDRMAESFRRSAEISRGSSEQSDLGQLLPSVFGGTTTYVTTCKACGTESERREDFMELSIPIVDSKEVESGGKKKAGSKLKKDRGKATASDVDVQHCVDSYLHPESLDGDNQYECSRCDKKCDATRRMIFAKLPPVLNLQLARYVFDRETLSKRKLTTKVLLPTSLEIPSSATRKENEQVTYILCSVQNHLGTSAHGGHYVADVMDWTTGVWYEFNDEEVTILEGGPVSSFEPPETNSEGQKQPGNARKVSGSQDAYNLFYVEQNYLASQSVKELRQFTEKEETAEASSESLGEDGNILSTMKVEREKRYKLEQDLQTSQLLRSRRIQARQKQITETLLPTHSSQSNKVWVDSDFLRRFFSCQDDLEDLFHRASRSNTILESESFLCEHSLGLHPRVARQGKLISLDMYNALESIVKHEYAMFLEDQSSDSTLAHELKLMDRKFVDGENLTCEHCGLSYQRETKEKFELFNTLISIHDGLVPGQNDLDVRHLEDPLNTYVVSRTWTTNFKKYMEKKVKELKNSAPPKKGTDNAKNNQCGGIDILDLSEVMVDGDDKANQDNCTENSAGTSETADPFKGEEDPTSKISCEHRNCPLMHKRQQARLISADLQEKISKAFSTALSHRYEVQVDDALGDCEECLRDKVEGEMFGPKLKEWKDKTADTLDELLKRRKQMNRLHPLVVDTALTYGSDEPITLRALHGVDVQRWRDSFDVVAKAGKKKSDVIRKQLNELLFIPSETSSSGREWRFRPLICDHDKALLPRVTDREDVKNWLEQLNKSNVELLLGVEYDALFESLSTLGSILHNDHGSAPLPQKSSLPAVTIRLEEVKPIVDVSPNPCYRDCSVAVFSDERIEDGKVVTKPKQPKRQIKKVEEEEPKGPLCKVIVHEVDNGSDIEVAASLIMMDVKQENEMLVSATGRPRRSRKARGDSFGGGTGGQVYEIEMAMDGNLAHFRLLLNQSKDKKLYGQRLYLIRDEATVEELEAGSGNIKTMQEIISGPLTTTDVSSSTAAVGDSTIHMALSYNSVDSSKPNTRKRVSEEEKEEEETLLFSLTEIQDGGWKTSGVVIGGTKTKRRRQERGFQGTFLQSTEFSPQQDSDNTSPPQDIDASDTVQSEDLIEIVDSPEKKSPSNDEKDEVTFKAKADEEGTPTSDDCTSPNNSVATQPDDDDQPVTQQFDDGRPMVSVTLTTPRRIDTFPCYGCGSRKVISVCTSCYVVYFCIKCEQDKFQDHCRACHNRSLSPEV